MGFFTRMVRSFTPTDTNGQPLFSRSDVSGVTVNEHTALQLSAANGCLRLIARTVGTLPLSVVRKTENGREIAEDHPVHRLLRYSPNADQTPAEWKQGMTGSILRWGNSYNRIVRSSDGLRVVALQPLDSDHMHVSRGNDGAKVYRYTKRGQSELIPEKDILPVRGFSFNGEEGMTPIEHGAPCFSAALAADKSARRFFSDGMTADGVLEMDGILNAEQRKDAKKNILEPFMGVKNSGRTMILEGGMKYRQLSVNPEDAQLLETRRFNIEEICRWYGVPPILVGHSQDGMTNWGSGIESIILIWLKTGLEAQLTDIEEALSKYLLRPEERHNTQIKFNLNKLLRADTKARSDFYRQGIASGWMTRNEARMWEELDRKEGLDKPLVPLNTAPVGEDGNLETPEKENA